MALNTRELKPTIGSEIFATKEDLLSGEYGGQLRDLLGQRGVLVFPEINFTDDEQVSFTKTLGQFAPELLDGGGDSVHRISLDKSQSASADYLRGSMYWHLDGTMNEVPILASILSAKVLSPTGGDTEFCNTYAAYEALPGSEQEEYDKLNPTSSIGDFLFA